MIESGEGCDETFKDGVIMGIAHEALSIAAEVPTPRARAFLDRGRL